MFNSKDDQKDFYEILKYKYFIRLIGEYNRKSGRWEAGRYCQYMVEKCTFYRKLICPGIYYSRRDFNVKDPVLFLSAYLYRLYSFFILFFIWPFINISQLFFSYRNQAGYISRRSKCTVEDLNKINHKIIFSPFIDKYMIRTIFVCQFLFGKLFFRFLSSSIYSIVLLIFSFILVLAYSPFALLNLAALIFLLLQKKLIKKGSANE